MKNLHKIIINTCYGGFQLSKDAEIELLKKIGVEIKKTVYDNFSYKYIIDKKYEEIIKKYKWIENFPSEKWINNEIDDNEILIYIYNDNIPRDLEELIEVVEKLGEKANGECANLEIIECSPSNYKIKEYDGYETLVEIVK